MITENIAARIADEVRDKMSPEEYWYPRVGVKGLISGKLIISMDQGVLEHPDLIVGLVLYAGEYFPDELNRYTHCRVNKETIASIVYLFYLRWRRLVKSGELVVDSRGMWNYKEEP